MSHKGLGCVETRGPRARENKSSLKSRSDHKNSQVSPISIALRKIILVAFEFYALLHSQGQKQT